MRVLVLIEREKLALAGGKDCLIAYYYSGTPAIEKNNFTTKVQQFFILQNLFL